MGRLFHINEEYRKMPDRYTHIDGVKAIGLFVVCIAFSFLHGYLYTTNLSATVLSILGVAFPIADILIGIGFVMFFKNTLGSVGFTKKNLRSSLLLGIGGAVLIIAIYICVTWIGSSEKDLIFYLPSFMSLSLFLFGAVSEEMVFRGYIPTRLFGWVRNQWMASLISALLFLLIHYPVRWAATGEFSLSLLSLSHVIFLIILHFLCDGVYKKTNCLWGSIFLHFLYNILSGMIIIQ